MVLQKHLLKGFWSLAFIIHKPANLGIQVSSLNAKTENEVLKISLPLAHGRRQIPRQFSLLKIFGQWMVCVPRNDSWLPVSDEALSQVPTLYQVRIRHIWSPILTWLLQEGNPTFLVRRHHNMLQLELCFRQINLMACTHAPWHTHRSVKCSLSRQKYSLQITCT